MSLVILLFIFHLSSGSHLYSLPSILFDPHQFVKSDLLLHDFRREFPPSSPYRCLLQTESKYVYLNPSCQLLTRTSLKSQCPFDHRLKLEIVSPQNTSIYQLILQSNRTDCPVANEQSCQFEKNPYRMKLKENEIYKNFLQLKTLSSCSASNYLLSSTNSKKNFDYFSLNSSTGHLTLLRPLDYESTNTWKLVIQGEDRNQIPFYTYVIIDVDDVNDCPPLLSWNFPLQTIEIVNDTDAFNQEISIDESKVEQRKVIIANLIASDLDSPLKFELKISPSKVSPFHIDGPYGDSTFVLLTSEPLDREQQDQHILHLMLTDSGKPRLTSHYRLTIHISDINDQRPKFDQDVYQVDIQENNLVNTTLLQVFANDSDLGENGRVTYRMERNDLWIDPQTGVIRTNVRFDYEKIKSFTFNVTATDHPTRGSPLSSTALVMVNIIDQNDHVPQFPHSIYEFTIAENNPPDSYLGQVLASDADESASIIYRLDKPSTSISSLFHLSSTDGKLYVLQSLDRERSAEYRFHLIASDGYHSSVRIEIVVRVRDLNDELPRFVFPTAENDTLIIDRIFWNVNDLICQIEVQDLDLHPNHSLLLIDRLDQLKNYDYLRGDVHFESSRFFLDEQNYLFFNATNGSQLNEGVYYLAFKIVDGQKYFDEKLLKLIVLNDYGRLEAVLKRDDSLGLHLNNRFAYLQYHQTQSAHRLAFDQSNRFLLLLSIFAFFALILIGIACLFMSLLKCRTSWNNKDLGKSPPSNPLQTSESSTLNLYKPSIQERKSHLRVTNYYDYNDTSLLMLSKDFLASTSMNNDNVSLLEVMNEKELYDQKRNKIYSSWLASTGNRSDTSSYSQRHADSSTFQSFNPLAIAQELCPPKSPSEYAIAVVSSVNHQSTHTPVSSDDGFCGSSDISDPSYRQPYTMMKDGLLSSLGSTTRRVRFNLDVDRAQRAMDAAGLKRFEQMYLTPTDDDDYDQPAINSTVV